MEMIERHGRRLLASLIFLLSCTGAHAGEMTKLQGVVFAYLGPTDKYVPCVVLYDAESKRAIEACANEALACRGVNVEAELDSKRLEKAVSNVMGHVNAGKRAYDRFMIFSGPGKHVFELDRSPAIAALRALNADEKSIRDQVEIRVIPRLGQGS